MSKSFIADSFKPKTESSRFPSSVPTSAPLAQSLRRMESQRVNGSFIEDTDGTLLPVLEREHKVLKEQVAQYDRRAFLTPEEYMDSVNLKKRKLAVKDALETVRRSSRPPAPST